MLISIHAPRMGRDGSAGQSSARTAHFNPRAPHGARRDSEAHNVTMLRISIHAPRMGRDFLASKSSRLSPISIHAPRMGRDAQVQQYALAMTQFQSTRPAWGATAVPVQQRWLHAHFNPRAPHGARLPQLFRRHVVHGISIHAPRMGRDSAMSYTVSPLRKISIHAPRMGRDVCFLKRPHA